MNSKNNRLREVLSVTKPLEKWQEELGEKIRKKFLEIADLIENEIPTTPEIDEAINSLVTAKILCDAAVKTGKSIATADVIVRSFLSIERNDLLVIRMWMNPCDYANLRKYSGDTIDISTDIDKLRQGIQGKLWSTEIRITTKIPEGFLVLIPDQGDDSDLDPNWIPSMSEMKRF